MRPSSPHQSPRRRPPGSLPIVDGTSAATAAGSTEPAEHDLREEDLHALLTDFYARVERDALLAPYFASVDMAAHMPRIVDFWSTIVFQSQRYTGSAFKPHLEMPGLTAAHFERWVHTLEATVDAHAAGPAADFMKALGHRIAHSMQLRLGITPFESA